MKKLYILSLFSLCTFFAKAQYTLTSTNQPVIGDIEKTWPADTAGISNYASQTGTGQSWLYSMIVISPTATAKSATYQAKSAAPNSTAFGGGSLTAVAKTSDGVEYEIQETAANGFTIYGTSNPTLTMVYQDPERLASLPFTFGTFAADTYSSSYTSGTVSVTRTGTVNALGDGTGTLYMPNSNTYSNCLRIKLTFTQMEVTSTATTTLKALGFAYMSSYSKNSLLGIFNFTLTAQSGTNTANYYGKNIDVNDAAIYAGINEKENMNSNFSLYPNPATNSANLWFVLINNESYDMTITNSIGQVVRNTSYNDLKPGPYNLAVDLKGLPAGIYYVKLKGTKQEGVKKLIIE